MTCYAAACPFPTPARFGDIVEAGGWKDRGRYCSPTFLTQFKCYEPPMKRSRDKVQHLKVYGDLVSLSLGRTHFLAVAPHGNQVAMVERPSEPVRALHWKRFMQPDAVKQAFASLSYRKRLGSRLE